MPGCHTSSFAPTMERLGGNLEQIEELVRRGANLEIALVKTYPGATPLVTALEFSQPEAAKLLLDRGASTARRVGRHALSLAARSGAVDVIEALLARGVSVKGTTALHAAVRGGGSKAVAPLGRVCDAPERDPSLRPYRPAHDPVDFAGRCAARRAPDRAPRCAPGDRWRAQHAIAPGGDDECSCPRSTPCRGRCRSDRAQPRR